MRHTSDHILDPPRPWIDRSRDVDARVDALLADLSDEERTALALAEELAQAYLELAGFDDGPALVDMARIPVAAGESTDASMLVRQDAFLRYDPKRQQRALVRGSHVLRVDDNAADGGQPIPVRLP